MKCNNCGAEINHSNSTCEFCGSSVTSVQVRGDQVIFEKIKQSPEYLQRDSVERQARLPKIGMIHKIFPIVFFAIFIGIAVTISIGAFSMVGFGAVGMRMSGSRIPLLFSIVPLLMSIVPIGFVVIGIFGLISVLKKSKTFEEADVLAQPAIVTGKRTQVSGGGKNSSASTYYYIICELEEGQRMEFKAMTPQLYGRIAEDDAGVLFTRTDIALDFDRVQI